MKDVTCWLELKYINDATQDELCFAYKTDKSRRQQQWAEEISCSQVKQFSAAFSLHRESKKHSHPVRFNNDLLKCYWISKDEKVFRQT